MLLLAHQVLSERCISAFTHYILSNPTGRLTIIRTFKKTQLITVYLFGISLPPHLYFIVYKI